MATWMICALLGFVGLYCLTGFAQSTRLGLSGPISTYLSIAQIPAAISIIWAMAIEISWWAAGVFVGASLAAGTMNGILMRANGRIALVDAQPLRAICFTVMAIAIWIPRFI